MRRRELAALRQELREEAQFTDEWVSELILRVVALEEIVAARPPRRVLVRARLARALRGSVRHVHGRDFTEKRLETASTSMTLPGWVVQR